MKRKPKKPKPATRGKRPAALIALLAGCDHCDYDEAEGDLVQYCSGCCAKVMAWCLRHIDEIRLIPARKTT